MPIHIGETNITNLKIGSTTVDKVYVGNTLVYPENYISDDVVFLVTSSNRIYTYDPLSKVISERYSLPGLCSDITNSSTKIWVLDYSSKFIEYDLTISPVFNISYNRDITISGSFGVGLGYLDSTHLVGDYIGSGNSYSTIGYYDISGGSTSIVDMFDLPANRHVTGDIVYNEVADKFIISNYDISTTTKYISQYLYDGTPDYEIETTVNNIFGLYQYNSTLYAITSPNGDIYEITASGLVYTETTSLNVYGASQKDGRITVELPT